MGLQTACASQEKVAAAVAAIAREPERFAPELIGVNEVLD